MFVEIEPVPTGIKGVLRFMDDRFGLVLYDVNGSFDGTRLSLEGAPKDADPGVQTGTLAVLGDLTSDGQIRGDWKTKIGTAGTFVLFPHDAPPITTPISGLPEQVHTVTRELGALRLYADDVRDLVSALARDFRQPKVIVSYRARGATEISKYAEDFLRDPDRPDRLKSLRLFVQEPDAYGIIRSALVELRDRGANEVRVQGVQDSWVLGKAEALAIHLRQYEKFLATGFRKVGLNINTALVLFVLVLSPELPLVRRIVFFLFALAVILGIGQLHARFIPNVAIYLAERKPGVFERSWPQIASWLIAVTSALAAAIAYGLLKGNFPSFLAR